MKILSVDDSPENRYLLETLLGRHGHTVVSACNGADAFAQLRRAPENEPFDVIVTDILMPEMDGFQLCREVKSSPRFKTIPIVVYTATYTSRQDEEFALSLGASRFIVKPAEPEEFMAALSEVMHSGLLQAELLANPGPEPAPDEDFLRVYNQRLIRKLERKVEQLEAASKELKALVAERDAEIARRTAAEADLRRSQERLSLVWENSLDGMLLTGPDGEIFRVNASFARLCGIPASDLEGSTLARHELRDLVPSVSESVFERSVSRDGSSVLLEGATVVFESPSGPGVFSLFRDITEARRKEAERAVLESQLAEARKLESVGRLAGGVAHDFNNLLTVINGYSEMLLLALPAGSPAAEEVAQIRNAGGRAADLTRQLLAFSRKQKAADVPLSLNTVIRESIPMLRRLVGDHIVVATRLEGSLGLVLGDAGQFLQVLMNLAANARDAMPEGGTLTIATSNAPSERVSLVVSDTGTGVDKDILSDIFDPFFTTKAEQGTGLGLFTVAGIVQRNGGVISVRSGASLTENPASAGGTAFEILLPRVGAARAPVAEGAPPREPGRGTETILVVEDRRDVRELVVARLRACGYRVLEAASGNEAILASEQHPDSVDLLLTDILMPHMTGRELASRLTRSRPAMKVLYMSGVLPPGEALDPDLIMKPFSDEDLTERIRRLLDARRARGASGLAGS